MRLAFYRLLTAFVYSCFFAMPKPSFFIVGAPKCGTTALYAYLKQHPQVFMPAKELYYFGSDFTFQYPRAQLSYYLSLFKPATPGQLCGEASVWYLYSKNAAKEIKQFNPDAKIIIMLRNPIQMLYSLHSQQVYEGNENIPVFEQALLAEPLRRQGKLIPPLIGCPYEGLYYSDVANYAPQVARYIAEFGADNVLIIIYDDFAANAAHVYEQTLHFLGIDPTFTVTPRRINPNKTARFAWLRNLLKFRPPWLVRVVKVLLPSKKLRTALQNKLWSVNTQYQPRPPMNPNTLAFLQTAFKPKIAALSQLLNQNLSHWAADNTA